MGEWRYETEATGTENVRSLDGVWLVAEGRGEIPGCGTATMMMTLGYDSYKQRYVGTWIGSMITHLWIYKGELDAAEMLTLNTEEPAMTDEQKMAKYQDAIEFKSNDHWVLASYVLVLCRIKR